MRIPKAWVPLIAKRIADNLASKEMLKPRLPMEQFVTSIEAIIMDEFTIEDRVNDEVREILKKYESEIERGRADYRKLFEMTKQKIVRERNLVL